jgi:hypothetical protein
MQLLAVGAAFRASLSGLRIRGAPGGERDALVRLGKALAVSKTAGADPALRGLLTQVAKIRLRVEALSEDISRSVEADLADYPAAAAWARPLVVVRGRSSRAVLRYRRTLYHRALSSLYEALGRAAMQKPGARAAAVPAAQPEREFAAADGGRYFAPSEGAPAWMTGHAADRFAGRTAQVLLESDTRASSVNGA